MFSSEIRLLYCSSIVCLTSNAHVIALLIGSMLFCCSLTAAAQVHNAHPIVSVLFLLQSYRLTLHHCTVAGFRRRSDEPEHDGGARVCDELAAIKRPPAPRLVSGLGA